MISYKKTICFILLFLGFNEGIARDVDCWKTALTQFAMNNCASKDEKKANQELEKAYQSVIKKIRPESQIKIKKARAAWTAYVSEECEFEYLSSKFGSVYPMLLSNCRTQLADEYTKRLTKTLECSKEDEFCGGR